MNAQMGVANNEFLLERLSVQQGNLHHGSPYAACNDTFDGFCDDTGYLKILGQN